MNNMKLKKDVEVAETENRELQEEKFELGYRIGLSEGITVALEAINDLSEEAEHLKISPEILQKIRKIHQARLSVSSQNIQISYEWFDLETDV